MQASATSTNVTESLVLHSTNSRLKRLAHSQLQLISLVEALLQRTSDT
jgi:hypothetical protein